jgi:hypothetical protein
LDRLAAQLGLRLLDNDALGLDDDRSSERVKSVTRS